MNIAKSLLLGSAASLAAIAGAQAADLPVKAKAVEYVRVCSAYGAGFYYIPGTETCIKIGGFFRTTVGFNAINAGPGLNQPISYRTRDRNYYSNVHRVATQVDVRSNTQYGVLRTYVYTYLTVGNEASATPTIQTAFTQLAGFTLGRFRAPVYAPWASNMGTYNAGVLGADDNAQTAGLQYQADFGGGLTASIGVFDARRSGIYDRADALTMTTFTNSTGVTGTGNASRMPDIQGNVRLEQAWGGVHLGAALSEKNVIYNGSTEPTGAAATKYGYIVNAALNLKQLPTGAGDQFWISAAYTKGDVSKLLGIAPTTQINLYGPGSGASYNSLFFGNTFDSVFDSSSQVDGGKQHLTEAWTIGAAYEHFWIPSKVKSSIYGNYAQVHYDAAAKQIICSTVANTSRYGFTAGSVCDPDFKFWTVGSRSTWNVTTDLEVSLDVNYLNYGSSSAGTLTGAGVLAPFKPTGAGFLYSIADQGMWTGQARVIRSW